MNVQSKLHQISLASIVICFFVPQVQAGFWDDAVSKVKSVTEEVIKDTADGMTNEKDKSPGSPSKTGTSTSTEEKKQVVKNATPTETSSAVASVQPAPVTETTASQYSDVDIIGLKLGMTQDQVIAVLKKHNKSIDITFSEFKVPLSASKKTASIPDHVTAIDARIGDARYRPNEIIIVRFSSPPSNNTVNEIVRKVGFSQDTLTNTLVSALKEKYGTPTPKPRMLVWNFSANSTKNPNCHMMAYMGHQDRFYKTQCSGMELIAMVDTRKEILSELQTALIDHGEIARQILATNNYRAQLKQERRQAKLKKANQSSAPTL